MEKQVRRSIRIGDIFEVQLDGKLKSYLQFIGRDITQLNMDILRVFKTKYSYNDNIPIEKILLDEVHFYTHVTSIKLGEESLIWKKIGKSNDIGDITKIIFRDTHDWGIIPKDSVSKRWHIWQVGGKWKNIISNFDQLAKTDIGIGFRPSDILARIQTNKYPFKYPGYPGEEEKKTTL